MYGCRGSMMGFRALGFGGFRRLEVSELAGLGL